MAPPPAMVIAVGRPLARVEDASEEGGGAPARLGGGGFIVAEPREGVAMLVEGVSGRWGEPGGDLRPRPLDCPEGATAQVRVGDAIGLADEGEDVGPRPPGSQLGQGAGAAIGV